MTVYRACWPTMYLSDDSAWRGRGEDAIHWWRINRNFSRSGSPYLPKLAAGSLQGSCSADMNILIIMTINHISIPCYRSDSPCPQFFSRAWWVSSSGGPDLRWGNWRLFLLLKTGLSYRSPACRQFPHIWWDLSRIFIWGRQDFDWLIRRPACSRAWCRRIASCWRLFIHWLFWSRFRSFPLSTEYDLPASVPLLIIKVHLMQIICSVILQGTSGQVYRRPLANGQCLNLWRGGIVCLNTELYDYLILFWLLFTYSKILTHQTTFKSFVDLHIIYHNKYIRSIAS